MKWLTLVMMFLSLPVFAEKSCNQVIEYDQKLDALLVRLTSIEVSSVEGASTCSKLLLEGIKFRNFTAFRGKKPIPAILILNISNFDEELEEILEAMKGRTDTYQAINFVTAELVTSDMKDESIVHKYFQNK